ncbi:MAG: hypothetical protein ACRDWE_14540 [Acidimicrobiales bacterium]
MAVARQYPTTAGVVETPTTTTTRLVRADATVAPGPTVPLSIVLFSIVAIVVAAWGAAAPFAGPDFGFVADRYGAWQWSGTSGALAVAPGVIALLAAAWVLVASLRPTYGRRPDLWVLGLITAACGAWFVVGQYVWPVVDGRAFIAPSGANHFMWKELCFAVGPGVILVLCGAMFMGWAVRRQLAVVAERSTRAVAAVAAVDPTGPVVRERPTATVPVTTATGPTGTMAPPAATPTTSEHPVVERPVVERPVVEQPVVERQLVEEKIEARPAGE